MNSNPNARQLFEDAIFGRSSRRNVIRRATALGISAPAIASLAQAAHIASVSASTEGTLSLTFYDWIINLHPAISQVNDDFNETFPLDAEVAPTQGFGIERFVQEAREEESTWDMYIGATPFLEMIQLAESGAIEPWDPYLPEGFLDNLPDAIRAEGTYNGNFYVWPFLLDLTLQSWNGELVEQAGLDPTVAPANWDEFIGNARTVQETGAAPFGLTFDFHAWRSLIPITHSINTDVYDENGLFMWNSDAAVQALEIMKEMMELANPDVLNEGTADAGVNQTPDEQAFASRQVGYYIKYQNAPLRLAGTWPDPSRLGMAPLPVQEGGAGGTVFWDTGSVLFTYGANKQPAADYLAALTTDPRIWEESIAGNLEEGVTPSGHLPVLQSLWEEYYQDPPEWLEANPWAFSVWEQLPKARAIPPTILSVTQFNIAAPFYSSYLSGETSDARQALTAAQDAVMTEFEPLSSGDTTPES